MIRSLENRRVLLTGVSRGVGYEIAKLFLEQGARVIGAARDRERLERSGRALSKLGEFHPVAFDLAAQGFERAAVESVAAHFGGALDVLFNNAAIMASPHGIEGEPAGPLERSMQVNVVAVHGLTLALLPALLRGTEPRIVNTSSGAGNFESVGMNDIASYRVSKFALNGLTMSWAFALRGRVAVNAFDPGWVKTDMGGPNAPGTPDESARGALALVTLPFAESGKFWKDGRTIAW